MKWAFTILPVLLVSVAMAQEQPGMEPANEQQLENQAERQEGLPDDDSWWQQQEYYKKHPLNLNQASEEELRDLHLLTDLQISNLLFYRKMLGPLISIYELQAIPTWDVITIHQLLPYVTVNNSKMIFDNLGQRWGQGEHSLLTRFSQTTSQYIDNTKSSPVYLGSPVALVSRYKYNYKNLLQYGITGDKDAGEQFFKGAQSKGFDFYSFHLFARKLGIVQSLAIGDFTVKMGQGLIQWQGLAFKKSVEVLNIKRQGSVLQPYNSVGEYNFHRGVGITLRKNKIACTLFGSLRWLSANLVNDSLTGSSYISSIITSGYNRSLAELAHRNNVQCFTTGQVVQYIDSRVKVGVNAVQYTLSKPLQPSAELYDKYSINGNRWSNYSVDYSYTAGNVHVFGEVAADKQYNTAMVHGLLASLDAKVDMAVLYRNISYKYQSLFSNAFTENSLPVNENGWYAGISVRPGRGWKLDAYADVFRFPWLKYLVNAPSGGHEYLVQVTYTPNKYVEVYSRFRQETKGQNMANGNAGISPVVDVPQINWRTQVSYRVSTAWLLRSRVEAVWYANNVAAQKETGFLFFTEVHYKPAFKPYSFNGRVQYVETGGYNTRLYAWENTVLYNFSIPAFFDKSFRYVTTVNYRLTNRFNGKPHKHISCLLAASFAQSFYLLNINNKEANNPDALSNKTAFQLQAIISR